MKIFANDIERYQFLIDKLEDIMWILDLKLNTIYVSPSIEKNLGFTQEERIQQHPRDQMTRDSNKRAGALLIGELKREQENGVDPNRITKIELEYFHKNGSTIWFENLISGIRDENGTLMAILGVSRNISERKKGEIELRNSEARYRDAYSQAEFYKDLLAHDIANVLSNIVSSAQLIEMWMYDSTMSEKCERMIKIIKEQVQRGSSLISNVIKLSTLKDEKESIQIINVIKILESIINHMISRFKVKNINIEKEYSYDELKIEGGNFIIDAFENILLNGALHNKNKKINLKIKISKIQKNGIKFVKFEFGDNGIGIKDERKELIFKRDFEKGKSTKGMGIGLSLVKKIIDSYGGQIWVENCVEGDYKQGSNFIVLLKEG